MSAEIEMKVVQKEICTSWDKGVNILFCTKFIVRLHYILSGKAGEIKMFLYYNSQKYLASAVLFHFDGISFWVKQK